MCDTIRTVAVAEYKSMTDQQLSAFGIGGQIHPWTFAGCRISIVSNLGTETADRNQIIHGTLLGWA
jgi:hypothetical protein